MGGGTSAGGGGPRQAQQAVSVLTFTNPNYSPSAPDVVIPEKKTFSWQRWKYDRSQERVYDMQVRFPFPPRLSWYYYYCSSVYEFCIVTG